MFVFFNIAEMNVEKILKIVMDVLDKNKGKYFAGETMTDFSSPLASFAFFCCVHSLPTFIIGQKKS